MILFNTTFAIDASADPTPFERWAKEVYIPAAMQSPGVRSHTLALIAPPPGDDGCARSYAMQFVMDEEGAAAVWEETASRLRAEIEKLYGGPGRVVWFSTYMDILSC